MAAAARTAADSGAHSGTSTGGGRRGGAGAVRLAGAANVTAMGRARHWWDAETGILSTRVGAARAAGEATSVHVVGDDGSWLSIDVVGGRVRGVEVAVWPRVRLVRELQPPRVGGEAVVTLPAGRAAAELCGAVSAYAERGGGAFHFRLGVAPAAAVWRAGRDVLLEAAACGSLAGVWLLNVPPSPESRDHDDRPH